MTLVVMMRVDLKKIVFNLKNNQPYQRSNLSLKEAQGLS